MAYVEVGWTMYEIDDINQVEAVRTPCIEGNRFPIWNQELNKEKNIFYFIQFNLVLPEISFQAST